MLFRVDGKLIRVKQYVVSCRREADSCNKGISFRVDGRLLRIKRYAVLCGRRVDSCKKVRGFKNIRISVDGAL